MKPTDHMTTLMQLDNPTDQINTIVTFSFFVCCCNIVVSVVVVVVVVVSVVVINFG